MYTKPPVKSSPFSEYFGKKSVFLSGGFRKRKKDISVAARKYRVHAAALGAGVGMCLTMQVIGSGSTAMMVLGIVIGIIGLVGMGVNYPIYQKLLAKGKKKYAYEILQLAREISDKQAG